VINAINPPCRETTVFPFTCTSNWLREPVSIVASIPNRSLITAA